MAKSKLRCFYKIPDIEKGVRSGFRLWIIRFPVAGLPCWRLASYFILSANKACVMVNHKAPFEDILITPVGNAPFFANDMFRNAYGDACPDFGQPLICFYRKNWNHYVPLCFTLFWKHENVMLNGGSVTNGAGFQSVPEALSQEIRNSEGLFFYILKFGFEHFKDDCDAFFATCGDSRAWEVSMKAGFTPTRYEHLIANFHKPMPVQQQELLVEKIHLLGNF